jgi:mannose-6-phosphate isomerase-like protein (cupin superfamily)
MPLTITHFDQQKPFITKDGSTIRSILDKTNAPVEQQSLAEATVPAGGATERHYHKVSEEFYFILEGAGMVEIDGDSKHIGPGDAVLIPTNAWHQIMAADASLRFLCCCAPPYSHDDTYFN